MKYDSLIRELKGIIDDVGVKPGDTMIISSGALAAHKLRDVDDLDVVVPGKAFKALSKHPKYGQTPGKSRLGTPIIRFDTPSGQIEITTGPFSVGGQTFGFKVPREEHGGIPHWSLDTVKRFKEAMGRPKDIADLERIKAMSKHAAALSRGFFSVHL